MLQPPAAMAAAELQVRRLGVRWVRPPPGAAAADTAVPLGPLDHLVLPTIPAAAIYVYAGGVDVALDRLERALRRLLATYPHLAGRLAVDAATGRRCVRALDAGAALWEASCGAPLPVHTVAGRRTVRLGDLPAGDDGGGGGAGAALLAPFEPVLDAVCAGPVLSVQHTRFACGAVALGVRLLHTVADAASLAQLMNDLAAVYRDDERAATTTLPPAPIAPADQLTALGGPPPPGFHPAHYAPAPEFEVPSPLPPPAAPAVLGRVLRFTAADVAELKARATPPAGGPAGGRWVSSFEALAAHLHQRLYQARAAHARATEGEAAVALLSTDFLTPLNCRDPSRLDLPPRYFGNALLCTYCTVPPAVLAAGTLAEVAAYIHDAIRLYTRRTTELTARWIAAQPDPSRVQHGFQGANGGFMLSQWTKLDLYRSAHLGDGDAARPTLVTTPFTASSLLDGLGYVLPAGDHPEPDEHGGAGPVDVYLALSAPLWSQLADDLLVRLR